MFSNFIEILVLSIVQGVSEFLPVSSEAHLIIISNLKAFQSSYLEIDISLHLGSLLAIIFYFRKDLSRILKNKDLSLLIILGSIPVIIVGFILYKTGLINYVRYNRGVLEVIAWTTLLFGILLFFSDKFEIKRNISKDLSLKNILIIGCFQILALIPGVSRSGIIITAGRFLKFNRYESSKISFYLSIPAIAGASFLSLKDIFNPGGMIEVNSSVFLSIFLSFIFSYLTVKYFLIFVKSFSLNVFVFYRIFLALILFVIIDYDLIIIFIILHYILFTYVVIRLANKYGRGPKKWTICAIFTNPLLVLILLVIFGYAKLDHSNEYRRKDSRYK